MCVCVYNPCPPPTRRWSMAPPNVKKCAHRAEVISQIAFN